MVDFKTEPRSGFLPERIVHLHPTRLCNLACLHCYSTSDPQQRSALDADLLCRGLSLLRREGYSALSISGGEPLVYPALLTVVQHARAEGFRVSLITNGLLVGARTEGLLQLLDGVAVSFDGLAATHNALRGRADAFERASAAVAYLAQRGRPVAAALSLTRDALEELPDLADHLVDLGACALQVRPVARAGRATGLVGQPFFTAEDQARLYLVVLALQQELPSAVRLHCDLAPVQGLWQQRNAYAGLLGDCADNGATRGLAELVNPLVITETGALKPIAYDFNPAFDIGLLGAWGADELDQYKRQRNGPLQALRGLLGQTLAGFEDGVGLVDWFDHCTRMSERVHRGLH